MMPPKKFLILTLALVFLALLFCVLVIYRR